MSFELKTNGLTSNLFLHVIETWLKNFGVHGANLVEEK
jgi:hypothetical protein